MLLDDEIRVHGRQRLTLVLPSPPMKLLAALRKVSILMCRLWISLMTVRGLVRFPHIPKATMCVQVLSAPGEVMVMVPRVVRESGLVEQKNGHR